MVLLNVAQQLGIILPKVSIPCSIKDVRFYTMVCFDFERKSNRALACTVGIGMTGPPYPILCKEFQPYGMNFWGIPFGLGPWFDGGCIIKNWLCNSGVCVIKVYSVSFPRVGMHLDWERSICCDQNQKDGNNDSTQNNQDE
jgi:hypothetical protein